MKSMNSLISKNSFRYLFLGIGFVAVIALTGMNVFSLYDIRDKMKKGEEERQMALLDDLIRDVRLKVLEPFIGLNKLEIEPFEYLLQTRKKFPYELQEKILLASKNSVYNGIYYTPENSDPCLEGTKIYSFDYTINELILTDTYPAILCDGVRLAKTKARIELNNNFNYKWNNNVEFDAYRTMNISLINVSESNIFGYLSTTLDKEFIIDDLITPLMMKYFSQDSVSGSVLWLHDWATDEILATNNPNVPFNINEIDKRQSFGLSMFDTWNIKIAFNDTPVTTAYNATLIKNMVVLGVSVLFLIGAFLYMFYIAERERALAQHQVGFLANVTHELKTPLAVMQAAGENISDGRVKDLTRLKQYGDHIYSEAIRLRKMVEKLLDVAKTDSGQTLIKAIPLNINEIVKNFLDENRSYIEEKGFKIEFIESINSSLVMMDVNHLENILSNLTENAIKFSAKNKNIKFEIQSNAKDIVINISDTGLGIPKKHIKNIFKKFYRVEDSLNAKTKGHGLGLSIVHNLVHLNGGKIDVYSDTGIGTTFSIKLPILIKLDDTLSPNVIKKSHKNPTY